MRAPAARRESGQRAAAETRADQETAKAERAIREFSALAERLAEPAEDQRSVVAATDRLRRLKIALVLPHVCNSDEMKSELSFPQLGQFVPICRHFDQ